MSDIVERLRSTQNWMREEHGSFEFTTHISSHAPFEAADEIEKLRAERDALRAALRQIGNGDTCVALLSHPPICSRAFAARAALGEKE